MKRDKRSRTWRALSEIARAHELSFGFKNTEWPRSYFGASLNHLYAYWYW